MNQPWEHESWPCHPLCLPCRGHGEGKNWIWDLRAGKLACCRLHWVSWPRQCWGALLGGDNQGKLADWPTQNQGYEWIGPPHYPMNLRTVGACEWIYGSKTVGSLWQGQHQDTQEESQWEPIISGIAEIRDLKPDQWLVAMSTCNFH